MCVLLHLIPGISSEGVKAYMPEFLVVVFKSQMLWAQVLVNPWATYGSCVMSSIPSAQRFGLWHVVGMLTIA